MKVSTLQFELRKSKWLETAQRTLIFSALYGLWALALSLFATCTLLSLSCDSATIGSCNTADTFTSVCLCLFFLCLPVSLSLSLSLSLSPSLSFSLTHTTFPSCVLKGFTANISHIVQCSGEQTSSSAGWCGAMVRTSWQEGGWPGYDSSPDFSRIFHGMALLGVCLETFFQCKNLISGPKNTPAVPLSQLQWENFLDKCINTHWCETSLELFGLERYITKPPCWSEPLYFIDSARCSSTLPGITRTHPLNTHRE